MMRFILVLFSLAGVAACVPAENTCKTALQLCIEHTPEVGVIANAAGVHVAPGQVFRGTVFCPSTEAVQAWLSPADSNNVGVQLSPANVPLYKAVTQTNIVSSMAIKKFAVGEKFKSDQGTVLTVQSLKPTKIMGGKPGNVATISRAAKACNKAIVYFTDAVLLPA